jgi:hypothetical protein
MTDRAVCLLEVGLEGWIGKGTSCCMIALSTREQMFVKKGSAAFLPSPKGRSIRRHAMLVRL